MTAGNLSLEHERLAYEVAQAIKMRDGNKLENYRYSVIKCQILGFDISFYSNGLAYAKKHFPTGWRWYLEWNQQRND